MCTVTWVQHDGGYTLFSNRDEKLSRPVAAAPALHKREGVRFVAPIDTAFGGSWIACNEFGLTVCLLNGRAGIQRPRSRGQLLIDVAHAAAQSDVATRVRSMDLSPVSAFELMAIERQKPALLLSWDGQELRENRNASAPLASSSFDFDGVTEARRAQFETIGGLNAAQLRAFHRSHLDGPGPYSPCMHRSDARTVSFTEVSIEQNRATMFYRAGAACEAGCSESLSFELRS